MSSVKVIPMKKTCGKGFTLIELSIVIFVMSIMLGTTLAFLAEKTDADKVRETERKLDRIEQAVGEFVMQHRYLPCPALSAAAPDGSVMYAISGGGPGMSRFGVSLNSGVAVNCRDLVGSPFANDPPKADTGAVPTQTLQIPDEYAFDAWGRRITYVMAEYCRDKYMFERGPLDESGYQDNIPIGKCDSMFTIRDASGAVKTTEAILVLVSHGKNGHGAFKYTGGTSRVNYYNGATVDPDELLNGRLTSAGEFIQNDGIYVQKSRTLSFDDIVRYRTRVQIIKNSGGMIGMAKSLIASEEIDPICRMIDMKLGALYPARMTLPPNNFPLVATAHTICGTTPSSSSPPQNSNTLNCNVYLYTLALKIYNRCY